MPISVVIAIGLVAASLPLLVFSVMPSGANSQKDVRRNLLSGMAGASPVDKAPSTGTNTVGSILVLPANRALLDKLLALAGRPAGWPLARVMLAKPVLCLVAAGFGMLILNAVPNGGIVVLVILIVVVAYFIPDLLLYSRGIERQTAIRLELPDTLDQMLIAVEAGLGFEASMSRAGENGKGPLAEELVRTLQDMRVGMSRREAYQALAMRTSVPDLRAFIRAVVQADVYGISISGVLRSQAKEMRIKRRQRAEEKALQIPVKVLFPLMLLILPVLFIAVLGPTVITVIGMFSSSQ
jgi:tight adherence protein C